MPKAKESASPGRQVPDDRRRTPSTAIPNGRRATDRRGAVSFAVTFRVRRLEPLLAWTLAALTLWIDVVYGADNTSLWLIAFLAACVGGWANMFPARQQMTMFARAVLLLVGGLFAQLAFGSGGAVGPYAFLPIGVAAFYALLLSTPWAVSLVLLALCGFALPCWLSLSIVAWHPVLVYAGFLLAIPVLAMVFGSTLRESDERAESNLRDDRTSLYNETGFFMHGSVLMAECLRRGRPFCMVLLNGADLLDIPALLGRKVASDLFEQVVRGIGAVSGEGIAARIGSVEFGLLLPGITAERAAVLLHQQLGDPPKVEVKVAAKGSAEEKTIVIVLDMAVSQAKSKADNIEDLYDSLHAQWGTSKSAAPSVAKVPVLGPDDARFTGKQRTIGPTVPMPLQANMRPWDK